MASPRQVYLQGLRGKPLSTPARRQGQHQLTFSSRPLTAACLTAWTVLYNRESGSWDSSLVRAPDSRWTGCEFESRQERRENFLLQSQLCVLTLIRCPFHPRVTAVARKRLRPFCKKSRWHVTPKHAYTFDPMKSEWADYAALQA